jgi:hypothetical protein
MELIIPITRTFNKPGRGSGLNKRILIMTPQATAARCTVWDEERYAVARQNGADLKVSIRLMGLRGKLSLLVDLYGYEEALQMVVNTMVLAAKEIPEGVDKLMGYREVTDMSLYECNY